VANASQFRPGMLLVVGDKCRCLVEYVGAWFGMIQMDGPIQTEIKRGMLVRLA
jgi:hypothetical protein